MFIKSSNAPFPPMQKVSEAIRGVYESKICYIFVIQLPFGAYIEVQSRAQKGADTICGCHSFAL